MTPSERLKIKLRDDLGGKRGKTFCLWNNVFREARGRSSSSSCYATPSAGLLSAGLLSLDALVAYVHVSLSHDIERAGSAAGVAWRVGSGRR